MISLDPAKTAAYRSVYRSENIGGLYSGALHLATLIVWTVATFAYCVWQLDSVTPWEWLTVPLAFLYSNLVEYVAHRFPMHRPVPGLGIIFKRHALQHHRFFSSENMQFDRSDDFKAVLFPLPMIVFFTVFFALPMGLLLTWLASRNVGFLFVAVGVAYYLNYELLHFSYHSRPDSRLRHIPGMKKLCRLHTTHHDPRLMQRYNFNITYPLCDKLFGTYHRASNAPHDGESLMRRGLRE